MNKIKYFRKCVAEWYAGANFTDAVEAGEALLREHWNNETACGVPYADDVFNLAFIYDEMGVWDRALQLYAESAKLVHEEEGDSLNFVGRVNNMAALLARLGRTEHAYRLYAHMVSIMRPALDAKEPALADGLYNLANIAAEMGKKEEALRLHKEALKIRRKAGSADDAVHSLHSLAFLHEEDKAQEKSLRYAKDAMELALDALEGPEAGFNRLTERENTYYSACFYLANLHESKGELDKAESLYETVLRWTEIQGGTCHSAYLNVASRLANIMAGRGRYDEALALHREVSENFKRTAGETHLFYANNLRSIALLHKKMNQYAEAEQFMMESIKIRRSGVDDITPDAIFLIEMFLQNNQPEKALEMLVYVLMDVKAGEPEYDDTMTALAEVFVRAGHKQLATLSAAMEELCRRDKVQLVIQKWNRWEKG
jgi:tetratricopeptide (TPR) repeat protein